MSIIDRITALMSVEKFNHLVGEAVKRELDKKHQWMLDTADAERYNVPEPYIYATQADMYRLSPILGTALDVVGNDLGASDYCVKRRVAENVKDVPNHPFEHRVYGSLQYPNPLQSRQEFMKATGIGRLLNGNHIWWLNRNSWYDEPMEIWEWPFERCTPVPDGRQYVSHYLYHPNGAKEPIVIPLWQIIHFKTYNPHSPFVGLSPIESLAQVVIGDLGMRKTTAQMYTERGGSPPDILAFTEWIADEAWVEMKQKAKESSTKNETLMLRGTKGDVKWLSRSVSNKDSDFVELLAQNMRDIFNRVAPGLLVMLEGDANRSTADAARATYEEKTRWTLLSEIAAKVNSEIMPAYGRNLLVEFDDPRVVDRQLELLEVAEFAKYHTIEEVRQEKFNTDPLGDERDDLLVAQVKITAEPKQEEPEPVEAETEQPQEESQEEVPDEATAKALLDYQRLKRMIVNGKTEKAQKFTSDYISPTALKTIKARLPGLSVKDAVKMLDMHMHELKPKPKTDPLMVLKGLELAVKALEKGV